MITTPRLTLRPFEADDLGQLIGVLGDPADMRFSDHSALDSAACGEWLQRAKRPWDHHCLSLVRAICARDDDRLIGYVSLSNGPNRIAENEAELGFRLAHASWGRGFATEAARAMITLAGGLARVTRVVAVVDPNNHQSVRVLGKVGMTDVADVMFPGYDYPNHKYATVLADH